MCNITLVCTIHNESGKCNSIELERIIELIKPEVIFEELSNSSFDRSYKEGRLITVETDAIKRYLQKHKIHHIPVDTFERPHLYDEQVDSMYHRLTGNPMLEVTRDFRAVIDQQMRMGMQHGFPFLNSKWNDVLFDEFNIRKEKVLKTLNNEKLLLTHQLEQKVIQKREEAIIQNIYYYSKENPYQQALMFIGSGHRQSIQRHIEKYEKEENIKLNWTVYTCLT